MKPVNVAIAVLMVPAMLGWLYYGVLLLQTVTSDLNPLVRGVFAVTFIFCLLAVIGLVLFAVGFWVLGEKRTERNSSIFLCVDV